MIPGRIQIFSYIVQCLSTDHACLFVTGRTKLWRNVDSHDDFRSAEGNSQRMSGMPKIPESERNDGKETQ